MESQTSAPHDPFADLPPEIEPGFLEKNWKTILKLTVAVFVAILGWGGWQIVAHNASAAASAALAEATDSAGYRKVIEAHPSTISAQNARLLLAAALGKEGKADEAIVVLDQVVAKGDPLAATALLAKGVMLAKAGRIDEAVLLYRQIPGQYAKDFAAPLALLAAGQLQAEQGKIDEARRAFEDLKAQYPESISASQAEFEIRKLPKPSMK